MALALASDAGAQGASQKGSVEDIIRREGLTCGAVSTIRNEGLNEYGEIRQIICDNKFRYLFITPAQGNSYIIVDHRP
jgi:hypothetical protein